LTRIKLIVSVVLCGCIALSPDVREDYKRRLDV
jgi:hypothetical protein